MHLCKHIPATIVDPGVIDTNTSMHWSNFIAERNSFVIDTASLAIVRISHAPEAPVRHTSHIRVKYSRKWRKPQRAWLVITSAILTLVVRRAGVAAARRWRESSGRSVKFEDGIGSPGKKTVKLLVIHVAHAVTATCQVQHVELRQLFHGAILLRVHLMISMIFELAGPLRNRNGPGWPRVCVTP